MKNLKRYLFLLLILCICAGCKSQQEDDVKNNPVNEKDNTKEESLVNEQNSDLQIKEEKSIPYIILRLHIHCSFSAIPAARRV